MIIVLVLVREPGWWETAINAGEGT